MKPSLTINFDNLVIYFDSEAECKDYIRKEVNATADQLRAFWAAPTLKERKQKRRLLSDARYKFARDSGKTIVAKVN